MFDKYFEVVLADTSEARKLHYMIRYQVYCEETDLMPDKDHFLKNEEWDQWDKHSVHFLVRNKVTGKWIGAMRLVSPENSTENSALPLCAHSRLMDDNNIPLDISRQSIELSRLCLVKDVRSNSAAAYAMREEALNKMPGGQSDKFYSEKKLNLSIIWGIFRATADYCLEHGIKDWYFLTNKALARLIRREGFILHQIGAVCERGGRRYPFKMDMDEIFQRKSSSNMVLCDHAESYRLFSQCGEMQPQDISYMTA